MCFCVLNHATGHSRWSNQINKDVPKSQESNRKKINYLSIRDRWAVPCDAQFKEFTFFFCVARPQARARSFFSLFLLCISNWCTLSSCNHREIFVRENSIRRKKTKERNHVIAKWGTTSMAKFERITSLDTQPANKQTQLADLRQWTLP